MGRFLAAMGVLGLAALPGRAFADPRPTLVVLIAVDQLRADLLTVYRPAYTGGLARLLREGRHFPNARVGHAPTNSMPGHVTLATGAHPRRHGIIDNGFFELSPDRAAPARYTSAIADSTVSIPGLPGEAGASPRRLAVSGLADWILEHDSTARVVAISMNEYGALLHAGRGTAGRQVYWYSPRAGRFVTSTYYARSSPPWLTRFNDRLAKAYFSDSVWHSTVPASARVLALPDQGTYEHDGVHVAFPHRFEEERDSVWKPTFPDWLYFTPYPDRAALGLAREAVSAMRLGGRQVPDYLSITLGSSDGIGHWYGPRSQEQLDNLLRLDRELGDFLTFLDRSVGRGRYALALAADHGAPDIPEAPDAPDAMSAGMATGTRVVQTEVDRLFQALNDAAPRTLSPDSARAVASDILRRQPYVAALITREQLADTSTAPADSFVAIHRNSYHPLRIPGRPLASRFGTLARFGLTVRLQPGTVVGDVPSEHGSAYDYDRRVALAFFGTGVEPGTDSRPVLTVDVAPTLAALAGIRPGGRTDGRPLLGEPASDVCRSAAARASAPAGRIVAGPLGEQLDRFLTRLAAHGASGAMLVARNDSILLHQAYGLADRAAGTPIRVDDPFFVGSLAKPMTATLVLRLQAEGALRLSDSVGRFFAEAPPEVRNVTVEQLLAHTSGLPYLPSHGLFGTGTRDSVMREMLAERLESSPGSRYGYSSAGYVLLAGIVERASGLSYEAAMERCVFRPARMQRSWFLGDSGRTTRMRSYSDGVPDAPLAELPAFPRAVGAGSVITTVGDLFAWYRALHGGALLPRHETREMFVPRAPVRSGSDAGYGWTLVTLPTGLLRLAPGDIGGYNAEVRHYVDEGLFVAFASNRRTAGRGDREIVMNAIARLARGDSVPMPPAVVAGTRAGRARFAGTYELREGGTLVIAPRGDTLVMGALDSAGMIALAGSDSVADRRAAAVTQRAETLITGLRNGSEVDSLLHPGLPADARGALITALRTRLGGASSPMPRQIGSIATPASGATYLRLPGNADTLVTALIWAGDRLVAVRWAEPMAAPLVLRMESAASAVAYDLFTGRTHRVALGGARGPTLEIDGRSYELVSRSGRRRKRTTRVRSQSGPRWTHPRGSLRTTMVSSSTRAACCTINAAMPR